MSTLEREEMDRLLDNAKSELFSEQRRFRHTLDSMQEVKHKLQARLLSCSLLCFCCCGAPFSLSFSHSISLSVHQRLEEVTQELEQKQEENRKLRERCSQLEDKLMTSTKTRQELQEVGSLSFTGVSGFSVLFVNLRLRLCVSVRTD